MPCTCRECLELAARGANVELLRCAAQDVLPSNGPEPSLPPVMPVETNLGPTCPIQRVQIVPFGVDSASAELLEDPDERAYIWELDDGGHTTRHH